MSREIKFRAWNLTENRFLTTEELIYRIEVEAKRQLRLDNSLISLNGKPDPSDEIIFQQYTGLKDKNGKEIYEGDILEIEFQNIDNVIHMIKAEVVYDNNGFYENWDGFDVATVKTHQGLRPLTGSTTHEYNGKKFTMGSSGIISNEVDFAQTYTIDVEVGNIFEGVDK